MLSLINHTACCRSPKAAFGKHHHYHSLGDVLVGHLELGEEDGAVLRPPAVYHRYHLVPLPTPAQGAHVPKRGIN